MCKFIMVGQSLLNSDSRFGDHRNGISICTFSNFHIFKFRCLQILLFSLEYRSSLLQESCSSLNHILRSKAFTKQFYFFGKAIFGMIENCIGGLYTTANGQGRFGISQLQNSAGFCKQLFLRYYKNNKSVLQGGSRIKHIAGNK